MRLKSHDDFATAILCARSPEADAVQALLDEQYGVHKQLSGGLPDGRNVCINGRMGDHDLVLCCLSKGDNANLRDAVSSLRSIYRSIELVVLVGTCSGSPFADDRREISVGDVVISDGSIEDGPRKRSTAPKLRVPLSPKDLDHLGGADLKAFFESQLAAHLQQIQESNRRWHIPLNHDVLLKSTYESKHQDGTSAALCHSVEGNGFEQALSANYNGLDCDKTWMRWSTNSKKTVKIHFGPKESISDLIAWDRDALGSQTQGASAWDGNLTFITVKGLRNYTETHGHEEWEDYAAATSASAAKTLLLGYYRQPGWEGK
ncbi:hypothetical protein BDW69DRAFT_188784 [Aspergillus filifer]